MADVRVRIVGKDDSKAAISSARGGLGGLAGDADKTTAAFGGLNTRLLNLNAAIGIVGALKGALGGIANALQRPFEAVASYERLSASIQVLTAREIMAASVTTARIRVGTAMVKATEEQTVVNGKSKKSVDDIKFSLEGANIRVAAATERLNKLSQSGKATATQIAAASHAVEAAKRSAAGYSGQLGVIPAQAARSVGVYKTVTTQTLTMSEAMKIAGEETRSTLKWMEKIAIQSPFDREGVAVAYKTALTYGFTGKQAKALTETLIDFAAATGASSDMLGQVAYPLGQIRAGSKVMTQDLRQLMTAGVPVQDILKEMGYTLEDVGKGVVKSDKFLEQFSKTLNRDFGGAAKAQAGTFAGLVSSFKDLEDIAMRNVFTPIFARVQPILNNVVESLQMPGVARAMQMIGDAVGDMLTGPLRGIDNIFRGAGRAFEVFDNAIKKGIKPLYAVRLALQTFVPPALMPAINGIVRAVDAFQTSMQMARDPIAAFKKALEALELPPMLEKLGMITIDIAGLVLKGDLSGAFGKVGDWLAAAKSFVDNVIDPALVGVLDGVWEGITPQIDIAVAGLVNAIDAALGKQAPAIEGMTKRQLWDRLGQPVQDITKGDVAWATLGVKIGVKVEEWGDQIGPAIDRLWERMKERISTGVEDAVIGGIKNLSSPTTTEGVRQQFQGAWQAWLNSGALKIDTAGLTTWTEQIKAQLAQSDFLNGITDALTEMYRKGPTTWLIDQIKSLVGDPTASGVAIGTSLGAGIGVGLEGQGKVIGEGGKAAVQTGMDAIKGAFGIASPSTWTATNIGTPLAEGIAAGIVAGAGWIENALTVAVLGPLTRIAAKALTMAQQMGGAMGAAGTTTAGGTATVVTPANIMALPKFGGIAEGAMKPLDILMKIKDAVLAYLSGSPIIDVVASLYAQPVYAGVSSMAPMPLDLLATITTSVRNYIGIPALDVLVSTYAKPIFQGISAMAERPLDLISQMVARVNKYIGIPATNIPVSVYAVPVFTGISGSAMRPLDIMDQMRSAVRNYVGLPVVDIPVRIVAIPTMTPPPTGPSQSDLDKYGRASGGPVSAFRPYVVGERGPELFVPRQSGAIVPNGGGGSTTVNLTLDGATVARIVMDRMTGMVYEDGRRYG